MPTKRLPSRASLEHLKHQAKDLMNDRRSGELQACQRIREFHPRFRGTTDDVIRAATFTLSDAHLAIAREYGFLSWARLRSHVMKADQSERELPHHERIGDVDFRRAVELSDDGDVDGLRDHLMKHSTLVRQRVEFEGGNYFRDPTLLEFVAENPVRHDSLPPNIVEVARTILDAGARSDPRGINSTLGLVCSGRVPRECGVQIPLIDLLCDYGADPDGAIGSALGHGEFEAVDALIRRGAKVNLAAAAATGRIDEAGRALPGADAELRHRALAWAAQYGHAEIVLLLLDASEDPNRYNPEGAHSHSTPLHQAALAGQLEVVRLLVERGARLDIKDIHYEGTPLEWAEYAGRTQVAEYLRARGGGAGTR
ncbi:MAG TPA: ankyrin repeat domain-containing protein [Vicinamibacterales bacterium]|nr:ankyrin repeat domain-containing protein [Vicinamibacterales bacterium]